MNDFDRYSKAWERIDSQIRKLTSNPIADFAAQHQALYHSLDSLACYEKMISPFEQSLARVEHIGTLYSSPLADFSFCQQNTYNNLVAGAFTNFSESVGALTNQPTLYSDRLTNACKWMVTPFQEIFSTYSKSYGVRFSELLQRSVHSTLSDDFAPLLDSFLNNNYQTMNQKLLPSLKSLASIIDDIHIHEDYVDVPAELFSSEPTEAPADSVHTFHKVKAISPATTRQPHWFVQLLLSAMISTAIATGFEQIVSIPTQRIEQKWHEEEMEKQDHIIQLLSQKGPSDELTTIMLLHMAGPVKDWVLSTSKSPVQDDSLSSYIKCHSADAQSDVHPSAPDSCPAESQPSTTSDSLGGSESPSEPD